MGLLKYIIYLLFFFVSAVYGQDQDVKFKHFSTDDGLSQSWVQCIYQDKFGFIWVGTDNGLNRFDGYNFRVYKFNPRKNTTVISNDIRSLFEDSKGNMWVGTSFGLDLYDRKMDRFTRFHKNIRNAPVSAIAEDEKGNLWIGTHIYLYYYDWQTDSLHVYGTDFPKSITHNTVLSICIDRKNNVWVGTQNGLNQYDKTTDSFIKYQHKEDDQASLGGERIESIKEDFSGRLWIGTDKGLDLFVNSKGRRERATFVHYQHNPSKTSGISQGAVLSLLEDKNRNLWVGTENGGLDLLDLKHFNMNDAIYSHFRNDPNQNTSLSNNSIYSLFQDKEDNIWIGTFAKGLNVFSKSLTRFSHIKKSLDLKNSISSNFINTIFEDDDFLWLGTDLGLNRINKITREIKIFSHNPFDSRSISANPVYAIFKDSRGNLWIGTWNGGLNRYNYSNGTFTRYENNPFDSTSIPSNNIFSIYEDINKNLWLGSMNGGLIRFDRDKVSFKNYTDENSRIGTNYISMIAGSDDKYIWLISVQSLVRFNIQTGEMKHYTYHTDNTGSLNTTKVFCIYLDSRETLWIGTDIGLSFLDIKSNKFYFYQIEDGLPDNSIKSILEDGHGNLWLGTNKGISKFTDAIKYPSKPQFKNYTPDDGLQGFEFNKRACFKNAKGYMFFGGSNGVSFFHPDSIHDFTTTPEVFITDLLIFNNKVEIGDKNSPINQNIILSKEIKLSHEQVMFSLKYAALNYISPAKSQYAYKLEGFEKEWNYVGNKREATYTNINPGAYVFQVKATNSDGIWNENFTAIKIIILPPWWATWWFKSIAGVLFVLILLAIFNIRLYSYRLAKKDLTALVQQRTQELEKTNKLLLERQKRIEDQAAELLAQTENLKETNDLLIEKQKYIQKQTEILEKTNQQLSLLNATKDKFFSIIAHDLRNPFHTVMGFSELLMTKLNSIAQEKVQKYIELIHTASSNGNNLLENLLHWSRSQTGKISFDPELIDLADLANQIYNFFKIDLQRKNISVNNGIEPLTLVYADYNMVLTVFRNLFSNAVKFTHEGGLIIISAKTNDSEIEISIEDNGIGISEDNMKLLFDLNSNYTAKGTNQEQGTGLGLILCKEFVERHKGRIWVESKVNEGSKFKFTLPLFKS